MNAFFPRLLMILAAVPFLLLSCAEEIDESSESVQDRILQAYIETHYPDAVPSQSGLYIVDSIPGTGRTPGKSSCVLVDYTVSYLDGTYSSYTYDSLAYQLGTHSNSGYYHPRIWYLGNCASGIVELLTGMKEGGMVKAIIPAVLLDEESSMEIVQGDGSSKIYEIWLREVIDDPYIYQTNQMKNYSTIYFSGMDSTEYGFYFIKTASTMDSITSGTTVNVRYIGKFLDGTVFDTNIADTAKKYRIYNAAATYEASSFKYQDNEDAALDNNSFIAGFSMAAWRMNYGEKAVTFFYSPLGYGDNGSGDIPGFVPLRFEIWIEQED